MSTAGGSEAKYDVILQKLAELKALVEKTDKKVGVLLNTEEQERKEVIEIELI